MKYLGKISDDNDIITKKYLEDILSTLAHDGVNIYISTTEPTEAKDGDLWIDLSSDAISDGDEVEY